MGALLMYNLSIMPALHRSAHCVSIMFLASVSIFAQSDDWRTEHDFGNRYEGILGENQGSPAVELRSFCASIEPYPTGVNTDLTIRYYVPDDTPAYIKAVLPGKKRSYVMTPKQNGLSTARGWRSFTGWKTADVLLRERINAGDLGVLIRVGEDSQAVNRFAAAVVYHSGIPTKITSYHFDVYVTLPLKDFSYVVIDVSGKRKTYQHTGSVPRSLVTIGFDASALPDGPTRVVATFTDQSTGEEIPVDWRFYHRRDLK